jgi:ABC-2 type transport system permease protein
VSVLDLVRAEYKLVYAEMIRRRSELILLVLYPYVFTGFVLLVGYGAGSPRVFEERVGVNPALFLITAGFTVMALMICIDDILWRPIWETWIGTLPYVFASPVNKLLLFSVMPLPRASLVVLMGSTSLIPLYTYCYGFTGILLALLVILLVVIGVFTMIPLSVLTSGLVNALGESWRVINIVRPLVMVLLGAYYPRFYMPLAARLLSYTIPPSHVVESVQRMLVGLIDEWIILLVAVGVLLALLYTPASRVSLVLWEKRKVSEGVKIS